MRLLKFFLITVVSIRNYQALTANLNGAAPDKTQIPSPRELVNLDVTYLFGSTEHGSRNSTITDLAPNLDRNARSISFESFGYGPMFSSILQMADRQQQAPPIPTIPTEGSDKQEAGADTTTTTMSPLALLLPYLLLGGKVSGFDKSLASFGSFGSLGSPEKFRNLGGINAVLNMIATTTTTSTTSPPPIGNLIVAPDPSELHLVPAGSNMHKGKTFSWKQVHNYTGINCTITQPRSDLCDELPVSGILSLKTGIVVSKGRNIYRVHSNGVPIDLQPTSLDKRLEPLTATATIRNNHFIFQGDKYTKYDKKFKQAPGKYPRLVSTGFPGVIAPVDGVFQLDKHTYVFISGKKFVYFQPDVNPNVDPRYSPQYLENVPGAPTSIDSAFSIRNRKFLHKADTIYELAPREMRVVGEIPVASSTENGWLHCPDLYPPGCGHRRADNEEQTSSLP